jgi:hypothetical protein
MYLYEQYERYRGNEFPVNCIGRYCLLSTDARRVKTLMFVNRIPLDVKFRGNKLLYAHETHDRCCIHKCRAVVWWYFGASLLAKWLPGTVVSGPIKKFGGLVLLRIAHVV